VVTGPISHGHQGSKSTAGINRNKRKKIQLTDLNFLNNERQTNNSGTTHRNVDTIQLTWQKQFLKTLTCCIEYAVISLLKDPINIMDRLDGQHYRLQSFSLWSQVFVIDGLLAAMATHQVRREGLRIHRHVCMEHSAWGLACCHSYWPWTVQKTTKTLFCVAFDVCWRC